MPSTDVIARFGGEEFILPLLGLDIKQATGIAKMCRNAIVKQGIPHKCSTVIPVW